MPPSKIQRSSILAQVSKRVKNPELIKNLEALLADDSAAEELSSMFLSRSEATKLVQSVKAQESEVEAQRQKLASDYSNLQAWEIRAKQEEITAKNQAIEVAKEAQRVLGELQGKASRDELTKADLDAAYANPKLASLASSTTVPVTSVPSTPPTPATQVKEKSMPSNPSTSSTPNPDEAGRAFIQGIGKLFKLQADHRSLFKEDLDIDALIATALQENRPVDEIYAETHDIAGKLKEVETARFEQAVNERVDKLVNEKLSSIVDPSGKSSHIGDFSSLMSKSQSPIFAGLGQSAKDLDSGFRGLTLTAEELSAQQAQFQTAATSIPNQRQEELEAAREFSEALAKHG